MANIQPVYLGYFADPFVWKHHNIYYAIGTGGIETDGVSNNISDYVFPLLQSQDMIHWTYKGNALRRPSESLGDTFWAPEVAYRDLLFYLYYSVGFEDRNHQLRVAASNHPLGPYLDCGVTLVDPLKCPFAIDPHPYQDDNGQWYLFYARDFLEIDAEFRTGTAIVADWLTTMTQLAGNETVILRARSDWQRFQIDRRMYGDIYDWHTLEGPCVRKHGYLYYCFYSGGRWETDTYGVDYGVSATVLATYTDFGNETGARVLHSVPGRLHGPGHNSIVLGHDNKAEYIAYHAWDSNRKNRLMHIDRLNWTSEGPRVL